MQKLTPQQKLIVDYLADGEWHCMTNSGFFMKDDRTRISELRKKGYVFDETPCDKRCGIIHSARLVMRKILKTPGIPVKTYIIRDPRGDREISFPV